MNRVVELRDLSDDHHAALVLAQRCKRAGRADTADSLEAAWRHALDTLTRRLEPHFRIEEQFLVPALEDIGAGALADRIRADHAALRALRELRCSRRALANFGRLLERHVRFEERNVFESVQHRLAAATLTEIAAACRALRRLGLAALSA